MGNNQCILENVPEVGFGRRADDDYHFCPLPGSLHAVLAYRNEAPDYMRLMALSGAAFRSVWQKDDGGNVDLMYLAPTPHERLLDALGYDYDIIDGNDETALRRAIIASIDRGTPVIAFGIIGPPEAGLVTGYENGGDIVRGWSYFDHEPANAYYRRDNWFARMAMHPPIGAIVLRGKRIKKPTDLATAVATLEWAIDLATTKARKNLPNHVFGTAAYDAWATALTIDADFPANDAKVMAHRRMLYDDQLMMLSERGHAAQYLADLAESFPIAAEPLNKASALYKEAGDRASPLSVTRERIVEKKVRTDAVVHIHAARDAEAAAVEELKKALAILQRPPEAAKLEPSALAQRDPALSQTPENVPVPAGRTHVALHQKTFWLFAPRGKGWYIPT